MKVITISAPAQHGKDTMANFLLDYLESNNRTVIIIHYADYLKFICRQYYGWDGKKDESGRQILQQVGTEKARANNPNIWVNVIKEFLRGFGADYDYVIIPDARFPNEIDEIKAEFATVSIKLNRIEFESNLTEEQKQHSSETALDRYWFDLHVDYLDGLENVKSQARLVGDAMILNEWRDS